MSNAADRDSVDQQLTSVADELAIPASTVQITRVRLNQLGSEPEIEDQSLAIVGATTLALSAREDGLPITVADIAEAWSEQLDDGSIEPGSMTALFDDIAANLDMDGTPPEPRALIERFGAELELADGIVVVAKRILEDAFEADPQTVAGGTSPAGTAGAVLYLAANVNGIEGVTEDALGDVSETSQVTVRNRYKSIRELLGEDHLETAERYQLDPDTGAPMSASSATASADGGDTEAAGGGGEPEPAAAGDDADSPSAEATSEATDAATGEADSEVLGVVQSLFPDELPTTDRVAEELGVDEATVQSQLEDLAEAGEIERKRAGTTVVWLPGDREGLSPDLTEDAVQNEVDALAAALDISASVRLFARGLVSDAVEDIPVENAGELAGAALLAACRINDVDVDATDIAEAGEAEARALYEWLDRLADAVDVEIPRLDADVYVERLVETLDLDDSVREESLRALEQYEPRPDDPEYTAPELAAGAMVFAATVGGASVDPEQLSQVSGADPEFISDAMNSILVSLCLGLVRGDIAYEDTPWTSDLLESELSPDFGDSKTGKAIALAKTYCAGRESQSVDDPTIDVLLGE